MKHSWNFSSRFQHHLSITGVSKVDEHFPVPLFFQHPYQVWHFFVEVIILFAFISLVVYMYKRSYPFLGLVVPTGTYSYFISFMWSIHVIKCQGAALNPPTTFSLLDNFKYFFFCLMQVMVYTSTCFVLLFLIQGSFILIDIYFRWEVVLVCITFYF